MEIYEMPEIEMTQDEIDAFEKRYELIMASLSELDKLNYKKLKKEVILI